MKCLCEQGLDGGIKGVCEHHRRYLDGETALLRVVVGQLESEVEVLRGLVEIRKLVDDLKVVKKRVK